ncbi:hypothetical protein Acy02nite_00770 [Actinoplanes cyaneus]|uniref:Histidine kinase/HSP90-like ATPase domain-containing protein n=1 Tax=Actinoplanes cyaneus TaxID=52696 RepID=A0A919M8P4_9ACTN|nr:ATP-binding protein [Actinoplanes cyaneus]MCW2142648.1 Histidine kinase-, DNA gyrase B-, and HSP90-like ATPase [Actinoplanes cyaneus]GID62196.1 hypothetical protein Acy02nite_00770 [Actinoplanes cyaneus]
MSERAAHRWTVLAGLGGCLLIVVDRSSGATPTNLLAPAVVVSLLLVRRWPVLLLAGVALIPAAPAVAFAPLVVGVLGAAQSLLDRGAPGRGAGLTGVATGALLFGDALAGQDRPAPIALLVIGAAVVLVAGAAVVPAAGAAVAAGAAGVTPLPAVRSRTPATGWTAGRVRLMAGAATAAFLISPVSLDVIGRLGLWLGVGESTFDHYPLARVAITGTVVLMIGIGLAAVAGKWSLAGAAAAATVQIGVSAPLALAVAALAGTVVSPWPGAIAGVAAGAAVAATRWRVPAAALLTVGAASALFIAYEAAGGHPEKAVGQHRVLPALVLLVLVTAAATAVTGAIAPVLAGRGAIPAALGPLAGTLTLGGMFATQVSFVRGRTPVDFTTAPVPHMVTAGYLLLAAGAAVGGLGVAHHITERWAERQRAELIRLEAAAAERDRLARPIHDGVLQVLALVQREGAGLGGSGARLAELAAEQEVALRTLLSGGGSLAGPAPGDDLRAALLALATPAVEVAAPATPVVFPAAGEVVAAVRAALENVVRHAGPGARAWVLLEDESQDEGGGVRVTVRDDGAGFVMSRLDEAARAGRLGVAQSMRGRIRDLGGTTTIHSSPGQGTEVEFWIPRRARRQRGG